jgi:phage N-6-adenine-methyltransferase
MSFVSRNHPQQIAVRGALDDVDDRGTKPEFIATLEERFGAFHLDVAAAAHNAKAPNYYTRTDDGLSRAWFGRVWCNPPYSDCGTWVEKAWQEWRRPEGGPGNPSLIVMLLPANRVEQGWWQDHVEPHRDKPGSPLRVEFLRGRMRFDRPGWVVPEKGDRPPFGLALLIWGDEPVRVIPPGDPICNERGVPESECPAYCLHTRPIPHGLGQ